MKLNNDELTGLMNGAVGRLVGNAMKIALSDFSSIPALAAILGKQTRAATIRKAHEDEGLHVPPFMIASIVRACNLRCKGCYDRAKADAAADVAADAMPVAPGTENSCSTSNVARTAPELDAAAWSRVFGEARSLGVSFILLAGGEPLLRADVIRSCSGFPEIIFPVFTNGLLIDDAWCEFFRDARNVMPVVSIEGNREQTDDRRGLGVYDSVMKTLALLSRKRVMFGGSITLTSENFNTVLSREYVSALVGFGMKLFFFVEYVPFDPATEALEVTSCQKATLPARLEPLRAEFPAIFFDFPGDEAAFGGCLASGRGFVHINASGSVESCPFAPYSDSSVADIALSEALSSPVLSRIRALQEDLGHTGGCTLFENRDRVEALLSSR